MPNVRKSPAARSYGLVDLHRLKTLVDAIFAFSLTLLALDLRLPAVEPDALAQGLVSILPRMLIFVFAFLVIAQQWDVHQRTMPHVARADGTFVWLCLLALMFVVLMPASADVLGRYPLQPLVLAFFGANTALLCLASWAMWHYAAGRGKLLAEDVEPYVVRLIGRLWLYPSLVIVLTMPLGFFNVYPVYALWLLMPIASYAYSVWAFRRYRTERPDRASGSRPRGGKRTARD
jgi:uncharacterized membrane protein